MNIPTILALLSVLSRSVDYLLLWVFLASTTGGGGNIRSHFLANGFQGAFKTQKSTTCPKCKWLSKPLQSEPIVGQSDLWLELVAACGSYHPSFEWGSPGSSLQNTCNGQGSGDCDGFRVRDTTHCNMGANRYRWTHCHLSEWYVGNQLQRAAPSHLRESQKIQDWRLPGGIDDTNVWHMIRNTKQHRQIWIKWICCRLSRGTRRSIIYR